jgi:hypothetical protein
MADIHTMSYEPIIATNCGRLGTSASKKTVIIEL